jgi:hypothetical protein
MRRSPGILIEAFGYLSDFDGRHARRVFRKRDDPPVRGFHPYLYCLTTGNTYTMKDTSNVDRGFYLSSGFAWCVNATSGVDTYGVVVGTGTTAVAIDDYNLATKIAHGTGSGQLQYGAVTINAPQISGNDCYCEVIRGFTNGSGATITVAEIGLVFRYEGQAWYWLMVRDVFSSAFDVLDTKTLTVTYKVKVTAP